MADTNKMKCPDCAIDLNHHADKIDYATALESGLMDPELGGVILEVHTCPECGKTEVRNA